MYTFNNLKMHACENLQKYITLQSKWSATLLEKQSVNEKLI